MIRYLSLLSFTEKGIAGVDQTCKRAAAFRATVKKAGGKVLSTFWSVGAWDGAIIFEAPDETTGTRLLLSLGKLGNVRTQTLRVYNETEFQDILAQM
jgi:uncharacterized protein with GYD domain